MHAFLRSQVLNRPYKLLKGCQDGQLHVQCVCITNQRLSNHDFTESKRLVSVRNPSLITAFEKNPVRAPLLSPYNSLQFNHSSLRNFSLSSIKFENEPLKPSSKVEATVQQMKKQESETTEIVPKAPVKKGLRQKVVDEILHYYHGFRLLFIDIKISSVLVWRVLNGNTLTRREYRLLMRTVGDMFRLVPFSVFIIVPFMELLLPFFIKFFPGMLPSTFQTPTEQEKEVKMKQNLKVKLEMAKFLQGTLDDMAVQHKDHNSQRAKEFSEFFHKIRTSGELVSNEEIMKYSKLFEDEITLDSLSRSQLIALCRVLEVQNLGTNYFLRFQLRMKLRSLAADDKMIQKEGVNALTLAEVQQACRARGMRAYGLSEDRVRAQLTQWLDLSLNEKVPPSLLLLSRALMLPDTIPTSDKLKATISVLPENIVTQTKAAIAEKEGKIDNKVKLEILKEEERKIKEERLEQKEEKRKLEEEQAKEKDKELLLDQAPILSATSTPILEDAATRISVEKLEKVEKKEQHLHAKDVEIIETAIDAVSKEKKFIVEKGEIEDLKEQMADYKEDVEDLEKVVAAQPKPEVKESKAAQRLFKSVTKMINKLDTAMEKLEEKKVPVLEELETNAASKELLENELLKIDDIIAAVKRIEGHPAQDRINQIFKVLKKMDDDCDGSIKVEDAIKVIELIGKENVKLSDKQIDELIDLLDKEELLEVEDRIQKALQKDKDAKADAKKAASEKLAGETTEAGKTEQSQEEVVKTSKDTTTTKPKFEAKPPNIPPVDSIDKTKPKDSSKML